MAPGFGIVCQKEKTGGCGIETTQRSNPSKGAVTPGGFLKKILDNRATFRVGESHQNAPRLIKAKKERRGRNQPNPIEKERRESASLSESSERGRRYWTIRAKTFASESQTSLRHPFQNLAPGSQPGF